MYFSPPGVENEDKKLKIAGNKFHKINHFNMDELRIWRERKKNGISFVIRVNSRRYHFHNTRLEHTSNIAECVSCGDLVSAM